LPNTIRVTVDAPDDILNIGSYGTGALIRVQSSTTEAGTFADVTGTGSTPTMPIVTGTRIYTGYDPAGDVSTWYRTRYESATASRLSAWAAAFQAGGDQAGLICSLYDVKQRLGIADSSTTEDENLLEIIRSVTADIQVYTGRRFVRSPLSGTTTFYFDVERYGRTLRIPQGIATMSTLEVATTSQPETGGTFTTVSSTSWFLRPVTAERDFGWPATSVVLSDLSGSYFYPGYNTVRATMALGWATVPSDVETIGQNMVVANHMAKASGGPAALIGPTGAMTVLRNLSPEDRGKLDRYRTPLVGS
jgi:hypothetical protein